MNRRTHLMVIAAGTCSILGAVFVLLHAGWWAIGVLVLLALGIGLMAAPEIFYPRQKTRATVSNQANNNESERVRKEEADAARRNTARWLIGIALLVTMGFGLLLVSQMQLQNDQAKKMDTVIAALQQQHTAGGAGNSGQLSSQLEKEMLDYFKNSSSRGDGFSVYGAIPWIAVLLVAIAAIVLALAAKEHPSAAPVLGVIPLAIAVIEHAEHLSKLDEHAFWIVFSIFLAIALTIFWLGRGGDEQADDSAGEGKKKVASSLVIGFSLLVLVFVLALVGYRQQLEPKENCPVCVSAGSPSAPATSKLEIDTLETTPLFDPGPRDHFRGSDEQLKQILEKTKEGDTILLLGSADCTRYSAGNWKLAQDRADKIKKALEGEAEERKVDVEARALKQHDACKPSDQLRAVFPILIRPESVGH